MTLTALHSVEQYDEDQVRIVFALLLSVIPSVCLVSLCLATTF